ncbi:hypothetical protein EON81_14475 [bacterium]|nr:MAG: hypothetical protein EON81_14475 [bacterium]
MSEHERLRAEAIATYERMWTDEKPDRDRLLREAETKLAEALALSPNDVESLVHGGIVLTYRAHRAAVQERNALFRAAEEKYAQATALDPRRFDAWHNWGALLKHRAALASGPQRERLLQESEEKKAKIRIPSPQAGMG